MRWIGSLSLSVLCGRPNPFVEHMLRILHSPCGLFPALSFSLFPCLRAHALQNGEQHLPFPPYPALQFPKAKGYGGLLLCSLMALDLLYRNTAEREAELPHPKSSSLSLALQSREQYLPFPPHSALQFPKSRGYGGLAPCSLMALDLLYRNAAERAVALPPCLPIALDLLTRIQRRRGWCPRLPPSPIAPSRRNPPERRGCRPESSSAYPA